MLAQFKEIVSSSEDCSLEEALQFVENALDKANLDKFHTDTVVYFPSDPPRLPEDGKEELVCSILRSIQVTGWFLLHSGLDASGCWNYAKTIGGRPVFFHREPRRSPVHAPSLNPYTNPVWRRTNSFLGRAFPSSSCRVGVSALWWVQRASQPSWPSYVQFLGDKRQGPAGLCLGCHLASDWQFLGVFPPWWRDFACKFCCWLFANFKRKNNVTNLKTFSP